MSADAEIVSLPLRAERNGRETGAPVDTPPYVEFAVASNFSFLRGASHPEELIGQAAYLEFAGMGLADRNSVAGVVRAHLAKRENKLQLRYHPGVRLVFADGTPDILAYPRDRPAWGRLCRLLTQGSLRAEKGDCILYRADLLDHAEGLELIVMPECTRDSSPKFLHRSRTSFAGDLLAPKPSPLRPLVPAKAGTHIHRASSAKTIGIPAFAGMSGTGESIGSRTRHARTWSGHPDRKCSGPSDRDCRHKAGNDESEFDLTRHVLARLREAAPGRVRLAATMLYRGNDRARLGRRVALARAAGVPLIAVNDVLYHHPDRRELQDVLACIREHVTIDAAGRKLVANAERFLKPPAEMARLFRDAPEAIAETLKLDASLTFSLDELKYEYPDESIPGFATAQDALEHLVWEGAKQRYPDGITEKVRKSLANEFGLIAHRQYAPYFLTVYDIVRFARSQGILCQGRGSAANSTVCYCLGVTSVDPVNSGLLFERFISTERDEPPDIDVDFEHERREEVIQYIYERYGRARTGIAATVISYRGRSAIREVGKAFGLSEDMIGALASSIWGMGGGHVRTDALRAAGLDPESPRVERILALSREIQGFPRHLSQHVGGFVITRSRLDEVIPIMNGAMDKRTHVEWDKDDLDALGILKVDVLGLGMLTCIRKAFEFLERDYGKSCRSNLTFMANGERPFELSAVPPEDPKVYAMLCRADSIGVFQVESRAQMSMLPRLRPQEFYDLVIEVAIVRPGPIQGKMVHPYLQRRLKLRETGEKPEYPSPSPKHGAKDELKAVLERTLGIPLFQEQAMQIAMVAGGFTAGEADKLRRAMATFKRTGTIGKFRDKMIEGMVAKGYERAFAERCFSQIEGFGEYGFPESHAASFALLVYASAWLKCRYPDVFAAALLNAQPMGFYASAQIIRDVREHGVEVRAPDINFSDWDSTLEEGPRAAERLHAMHREMRDDIRSNRALRLGLREIKGLSEDDARKIQDHRGAGFASISELWLRTGLAPRTLERLADADAFGSLGLSRRQALWAVKALGRAGDQDDLPLFATPQRGMPSQHLTVNTGAGVPPEPPVTLPAMPLGEEVVNDYRFLKFSLRAHPASFLREDLAARDIIKNEALRTARSGVRVCVSGLVTIRQRPGSANGVIFMTIEDDTAIANIIVWPDVFERFRPIVLGARYVAVSGSMQAEQGVIHVVADRLDDLTPLLARLTEDFPPVESLARADAVKRPHAEDRPRPRQPRRVPGFNPPPAHAEPIAADLDVPARGSAHTPTRRARG